MKRAFLRLGLNGTGTGLLRGRYRKYCVKYLAYFCCEPRKLKPIENPCERNWPLLASSISSRVSWVTLVINGATRKVRWLKGGTGFAPSMRFIELGEVGF